MHRPRVIPVLLVRRGGLVKTCRFGEARYVGDVLNAVKIFNDLRADEIIVLDIDATREKRAISPRLVKDIGNEANMPLAVGGGIRSLPQIRELLAMGTEKVVIGTKAIEDVEFVREASRHFGSSTIVACIDVRRSLLGAPRVCSRGMSLRLHDAPVALARRLEASGVGEIIVQSIDRDGTLSGYDLELIRSVSDAVSVPVVALGGAGSVHHLSKAYVEGHASAVAAGSLFVFHGRRQGVLINYPERAELLL